MSSHTADTELTFLGKLILEGEIHCETGLHIGAGKGSLEIGGADNPVVKDAFGLPYIPGSSLRGRLRSLLEQTPAWRFRPNWFICRSAKDRKSASIKATGRTTKSVFCSAGIRAAWRSVAAKRLNRRAPLPRASPYMTRR